MKLILNSFLIFLFLISFPVFASNFNKEYRVKVSGIKIGKLIWKVNISEKNYVNEINLKSEGILSGIFSFEGEYYSEGEIKKNKLKSKIYKHYWKTDKVTKKMDLVFQNDRLISLTQSPVEKEHLRINIFNKIQNKDPLTSFLSITRGETVSSVLDGRRVYSMNAVVDNKTKKIIVEISDYFNLWADHKRSKFEKIIFEQNDSGFLPTKIDIYFDGRIFKLEQN